MSTIPDSEQLAEAVRAGDRQALAKAITLVESTRADHRETAANLMRDLSSNSGDSIRLGISGVPGVGKSTFIDAFGCHVGGATASGSGAHHRSHIGAERRLYSRRQDAHAGALPTNRRVQRPSPTGGALGGVARHTRESIVVCEAAGFDVVIVETVGVGQSEFAVSNMTDMFILLLLPGGGDELQGIKRGIIELADLVLVNKSDGDLEPVARATASEYANAIRLIQPRSSHWQVPVEECSARQGKGIEASWQHVVRYRRTMENTGAWRSTGSASPPLDVGRGGGRRSSPLSRLIPGSNLVSPSWKKR